MSSKTRIAAAFLAYCEGQTVAEIATAFNLPATELHRVVKDGRWEALREKALQRGTLAAANLSTLDEARLEVLQQNREKNFKIAEQLRDDLQILVNTLRAGKLEIEEVKCDTRTGAVRRYSRKPGIGDRVALVQYAQQIAALGYQALGDHAASSRADGAAGPGGRGSGQPVVNIVLPFSIAGPRAGSASTGNGQPIDV